LAAAAVLDLFSSSSNLVSPSLGDYVEKLQKLLQLKNLDTESAEIMKSFDLAQT